MHWAQIEETGFVGGMRLLLWAQRRLGNWPFRVFLFFVMLWFFVMHPVARRASRDYLARLHQNSGGTTPSPTLRNRFRHFMQFGITILDKFLAFSGELDSVPCHFEGREPLLALQYQQRGAVLITAHLGNLDLCRRLHYSLPINCPPSRLTILVHTRHAEGFNRMAQKLDPTHRIDFVQVTDLSPATAVLIAERVAAGHFVVITGDRVPVRTLPSDNDSATMTVPFLGKEARFPVGPYVLAAALGCPVYMMFSARRGKEFFISMHPVAERIVLPRKDRRTAIRPYLSAFVAQLEEECRKNPLQWFNFFPFW